MKRCGEAFACSPGMVMESVFWRALKRFLHLIYISVTMRTGVCDKCLCNINIMYLFLTKKYFSILKKSKLATKRTINTVNVVHILQ